MLSPDEREFVRQVAFSQALGAVRHHIEKCDRCGLPIVSSGRGNFFIRLRHAYCVEFSPEDVEFLKELHISPE